MDSEDHTVVEYFVAATLSKDSLIYEWNPELHDESIRHNGDKLSRARHTLALKRVRIVFTGLLLIS